MPLLKIILIWCATLTFAIWTFVNSHTYNLGESSSTPFHSEALIAQNHDLLKNPSTENLAKVLDNGYNVLGSAPLSADALHQIFLSKYTYDNSFRGLEIVRAVKLRDARQRSNLKALVLKLILVGNFNEALDNLMLWMRLSPENSDIHETILDAIYDNPDGKLAVLDKFSTAPVWGKNLLLRRIYSADKESLDALNHDVILFSNHMIENGNDRSTFIEAYLNRYIKLGFIEEAKLVWDTVYSQPELQKSVKNEIFNPTFATLEVAAPFNWKLYNAKDFNSELLHNGGLYASFNSNDKVFIGRQFLILEIGQTYLAEFEVDYDFQPGDPYFEIRAVCMKSGHIVMSIPFQASQLIYKDANREFGPLPDNCSAVDLQILGMSSDLKKRESITMNKFDISIVDGSP